MLRALAGSPDGLSTVELAAVCGAPVRTCSGLMSAQERSGRVSRDRSRRTGRGRPDLWHITDSGHRDIEDGDSTLHRLGCRRPTVHFPLTEKCFLILGIYSTDGTGDTRQIREWLAIEGEDYTTHEVKEALRSLARMNCPLVEKVRQGVSGCTPSLWRYTEAGRARLAED